MTSNLKTSKEQNSIFNLNLAIKVVVILFMVLGVAKLLGQSGVIGGFAALLTALVDRPGSLRQRTFGLTIFIVAGYIPIAIASVIDPQPILLLTLVFITTFLLAWGAVYGSQMAHVCWVLTIWLTLVLGFKVWDSIGVNFIGYVSGSLLMMFSIIIPEILHKDYPKFNNHSQALIPKRQEAYRDLIPFALIRAIAFTIAGFIGIKYLQFNQYWILLTTVLIMPPALKIHWDRGLQRAVGTLLGIIAGYYLAFFTYSNIWLLLGFELIGAFLMIYTVKKKPYGMFVFFLSIFIVIQLGRIQDLATAQAGGIERTIATFIGIGIAFISSIILVFLLKKPKTIST